MGAFRLPLPNLRHKDVLTETSPSPVEFRKGLS